MANNDRLKQIISDVRLLSDLTDSMKDSEIYPVSFFSQAFDLMQKIQSDFHLLEADQVEMFASQMKKHQALILSIHRQMRNIGDPVSSTATTDPSTPATGLTPEKAPAKKPIAGQSEESLKKVSFLSRLGLLKEETAKDAKKLPNEALPETLPETGTPTAKQTHDIPGKPATKIIENPIEMPTDRLPTVKRPARPMPKDLAPAGTGKVTEQASPERGVSGIVRPPRPSAAESAKTTEKSTITIPVNSKGNAPVWPPLVGKELTGAPKAPESKIQNIPAAGIPPEGSAPPSLNDTMERRVLSDLRKAFNVNDRFRYRRELFRGNEEVMNRVISILNNMESYKDSILFLEEKLHWDFSNPVVKDFIKVLEIRFL
ncbi:MAG: hypothetical protein LBL33_08010 [Tannerella sp.]|jgi:hypothetical protein|nr:hypothetical protein [Tannerella sp.]